MKRKKIFIAHVWIHDEKQRDEFIHRIDTLRKVGREVIVENSNENYTRVALYARAKR